MDRRAAHVCIYCLREKQAREFNREHVLSEAFGSFQNAPPKLRCVCRQCNQYFGDSLEIRFARGAFEGMLRYRLGVRSPDAGEVNLKYVEFAIPEGHEWAGVRLTLVSSESGQRFVPIAQAAFLVRNEERWQHVAYDEISSELFAAHPEYEKSEIRIYAPSPAEQEMVISRLLELGVTFQKGGDLEVPHSIRESSTLNVEVSFTINRGIQRCVAKYAFNFLASVTGNEFVLGSDFDAIRWFIRFGTLSTTAVVRPSFEPILMDDSPRVRQTNGHLLAVDWIGLDLVAQVSLFNYVTYRVDLCRAFSGMVWRPIRAGLHYNIQSMRVEQLRGYAKALLP